MNLAILGKIGGSILLAGSSGTLIAYIISPESFGKYANAYFYTVSETVSDGNDVEEIHDTNYKCRFAGNNDQKIDCKVTKWKDDEKQKTKQYKLNDLANIANESVKKTELQTAKNIFKVVINGKDLEAKSYKTKNIEVFSTEAGNKTYANLKQVVGIYKGSYIGKTNYFIGKASEVVGTFASGSTIKCNTGTNQAEETCTIYDFASDETNANESSKYESLTFTKSTGTANASTFTQHKHYLIKLTTAVDLVKDLKKDITCKCTTGSNNVQTITFKDAVAAVYVDNQEHILVI